MNVNARQYLVCLYSLFNVVIIITTWVFHDNGLLSIDDTEVRWNGIDGR